MKILISGREIPLRDKDVAVARKVIAPFLETVKTGAVENNMPTLYVTVLAVLHAKTGELLSSLNEKEMGEIMALLLNDQDGVKN